jgi:tetratricopeptide (TPR) repeat protein
MLRPALALTIFTVTAAGFVGVARGQQLPTVTAGEDAEARSLFEAGSTAYAEGRYENALDYFKRSYRLSNRPKLLYNIGSAADKLRRDREALFALKEYLVQVPDAPNRPEVENRIQALQKVIESREGKSEPVTVQRGQAATASILPTGRDVNEGQSLSAETRLQGIS